MALIYPKSVRNYNAVYDVLRTHLINVVADDCTPSERLRRHVVALEKTKNKADNKSFAGDSFELMVADSLIYAGVPAEDIFSGVKHKHACVESDLLIRKNNRVFMIEWMTCLRALFRRIVRHVDLLKRDALGCMNSMHEKAETKPYREGDSFEYWLITNRENKTTTTEKAVQHIKNLNRYLLIAPEGSIVTIHDEINMERFFSAVVRS